jgi:hypothetical protein
MPLGVGRSEGFSGIGSNEIELSSVDRVPSASR